MYTYMYMIVYVYQFCAHVYLINIYYITTSTSYLSDTPMLPLVVFCGPSCWRFDLEADDPRRRLHGDALHHWHGLTAGSQPKSPRFLGEVPREKCGTGWWFEPL